jgi:hypothetical protein
LGPSAGRSAIAQTIQPGLLLYASGLQKIKFGDNYGLSCELKKETDEFSPSIQIFHIVHPFGQKCLTKFKDHYKNQLASPLPENPA